MEVYEMQKLLESRGITAQSVVSLAVKRQQKFDPSITDYDAYDALWEVLQNYRTQHLISVALFLDWAMEHSDKLGDEWQELAHNIRTDDKDFGVDEQLAEAIASKYGPIASTNYGYVDINKYGVVGELDKLGKSDENIVTTFADDIAGVLVGAVSAVLAEGKHR